MGNYLENMKAYLKKIDEVIEQGEYKDDWNTMLNHKVPDWYRDAKFGIFIHWGPYAVPAYGNEWYSRTMYKKEGWAANSDIYQHHIDTFGPQTEFGYKDFVPLFKAEKFDANEWADLFQEAGAKFVMPVAEHHDGFQMYDSDLSEWCASKKGPKVDVLGELKKAVEERDMVITASSHRAEHYWFMSGGREFPSDMPEEIPFGHMYWPSYPDPFVAYIGKHPHPHCVVEQAVEIDPLFMEDWLARTCEIVDKYQPRIVYFDWWIQIAPLKPYLKKFMAYYYNRAKEWGIEVTINYKNDAFLHTTAVRDIERGQLSDVSPFFWQNDTAIAKNSWCYTEGNRFKEPVDIICDLIDVVSKNGSLLLNVGPKADGTISQEDQKVLKAIGAWLKVNGEAIYGTYPFRKYGEGPTVLEEGHFTDQLRSPFTTQDFRFTMKGNILYAFAMKWPTDGVVHLKTLGIDVEKLLPVIKNVEILGEESPCTYRLTEEHLTIIGNVSETNMPVCIKITLD